MIVGYFLSTFLQQESLGLAGTGMALAFALVLSGVMPSLDFVESNFQSIEWVWTMSAPRWAIEAFWLQEVRARPFYPLPMPAPYQYDWDRYSHASWMMFYIGIAWHVLAFFGLKLVHRGKQK